MSSVMIRTSALGLIWPMLVGMRFDWLESRLVLAVSSQGPVRANHRVAIRYMDHRYV